MSKKKVTMSPGEITENWKKQMKASVTKMVNGVNAVTESPMELAAAQQAKMLEHLTESVNNGSWSAGLKRVNLGDWKSITASKIQSNLSSGVENATKKRESFDTWLVGRLNSVLPAIAGMPDGNYEDSKNRVLAYMDAMHQQKYKGT